MADDGLGTDTVGVGGRGGQQLARHPVTTPAALHRKLAASVDTPVLRRVGLEEVIQRRRSARFRAVRQGTATHAADL